MGVQGLNINDDVSRYGQANLGDASCDAESSCPRSVWFMTELLGDVFFPHVTVCSTNWEWEVNVSIVIQRTTE